VWRFVATASLVVVAFALAGIAAHVLRDGRSTSFRDGASGIALDRPDGWQIHPFGQYCMRVGPGLLVSNIAGHGFRNVEIPNGCTNGWNLSEVPQTFVLLDVSLFSGPGGTRRHADTPLPLSLTSFRRHASGDYGGCGGCSLRTSGVVEGQHAYAIRVWVGSEASSDDTRELEKLVRTLRFVMPNGG
jgi:hypothetical protein